VEFFVLLSKLISEQGEKLRTGWKENLKNLSEHALLLGTSEYLSHPIAYLLTYTTVYTQSPIKRNGHIRLGVGFWGKFKKRAWGRSNLRNASKTLRNAERSDFKT
jgi:hypothetical protein